MSSAVRTALVVAGLTTGNVLLGRLVTGPLRDLPVEHRLNTDLRERGDAGADRLAQALSRSSDPCPAITIGFALTGLLLIRRHHRAAAPALAMSIASATHVVSSALVGRQRPAMQRLGMAHPTSSFPSGHVGAMTALSVVLGRVASPLPRPVRVAIRTLLVGYLAMLGWSRLRSGQHYASDVLVGYCNGAVCGRLAWNALR